MPGEKLLSVSDIAEELNTGKATIKFLLKRFKNRLPFESKEGQPVYPRNTVQTLFKIKEHLDKGLLPGDIEKELAAIDSDSEDMLDQLVTPSQNGDIRVSEDGIILLKSLIHDIADQQRRIAAAHEKRAVAEERKAVAIEKRAQAEEKKAEAMNHIATALQEMNSLRIPASSTQQQIVHQAASVIVEDEMDNQQTALEQDAYSTAPQDSDEASDTDLSSLLEDDTLPDDFSGLDEFTDVLDQDLDDAFETPSNEPLPHDKTDDLSLLIEEDPAIDPPKSFTEKLDDLSLLLDTTDAPKAAILDDLSKLIDKDNSDIPDNKIKPSAPEDLDDLSLLLENDPVPGDNLNKKAAPAMEMDDLSALIEGNDAVQASDPTIKMDDLSQLIDPSPEKESPVQQMDDLSLLIQKESVSGNETDSPMQMDDLSQLIDEPGKDASLKAKKEAKQDAFVEDKKEADAPTIQIDISPEKDLEKYKAAIMKLILGFKSDGMSVEETTKHLNKNNIRTLSGKSEWGQKAISQIYKFIDSAK